MKIDITSGKEKTPVAFYGRVSKALYLIGKDTTVFRIGKDGPAFATVTVETMSIEPGYIPLYEGDTVEITL